MENPGKARCHAVFTAWHLKLSVHLVPRRGFTPQGGINFDSPAAKQQKRKIPKGIFLFCDYPQVLLFAPSHIAREGECEGETFAGFPTRVQSPARRRPLLLSVLPHTARKGMCARETFVGFPLHVQSKAANGDPDFCSAKISSTKREPPFWVALFWCLVGDSNPGHPA